MDTVLLTGAASGIGRAAAWRLARQGWRCVLLDRDAPALEALRAALPPSAQGGHLACVADLADATRIAALADELPRLDALINNAGMTERGNRPATDIAPGDWQRLLDLNLRAPARLLHALRGRLVRGARIVNVASGAGLHAIPWRGAYSPSKAGLIAQTRALARAHPEYVMTVLCPGFVRTELVNGLIESGRLDPARAVAKIPLGRMAAPEEMACALAFLAGPHARPIGGGLLAVDGGSSVFGGSQPCQPSRHAPVSCDAPLDLRIRGSWTGLPEPQPCSNGYPAVADATVLDRPVGQRLDAALDAARRHAHDGPGSLTLLLPRENKPDWEAAGESAALRMLVATLACEWGADARRVNAVEVAPDTSAESLAPLLRFAAGAQAQYLTGQTLRCNP